MSAAVDRLRTAVGRRWWTLQRFGCSPSKLVRRVRNRDEPRVVCITVPKSGTHLLERALCLHPRLYRPLIPTIDESNVWRLGGPTKLLPALRPGQVLVTHLPFSWQWHQLSEEAGIARVVLVRDPRAILVSEAHYFATNDAHSLHDAFAARPDTRSRIELALVGSVEPRVPPFASRMAAYTTWLETSALVVRFEDLVGAAGGGSAGAQADTIGRLYEHIGLPLTAAEVGALQAQVFSPRSPTFRQGRVDEWRGAFDDDLLALFDEHAGGVLDAFGYGS